ncbi:MAG: hypothetical protein IJR50_05715 [Treponema sp.]|nr:hypothetical protein [Treponema sp.]
MKRVIVSIPLFLFIAFFCFAQASLPRGYGGIELGMTLDEVKEKLKKNSEFGYHGDRDVSLLPGENRVLIETDAEAGHVISFLERCYFQFYNEKLYIIIINVNRERMDHYSIFSTLCEKYGDPTLFSPEKAEWKTDSVTMTLERPLALKYVDNNVFNEVNAASLVPLSGTEITREIFLDEL